MRTLLLTANTALLLVVGGSAQQSAATPGATVPRLVRIANTFRPASGPTSPVESVTLSIYKTMQDGTALWTETQNVAVDAEGRYAVLLGSTLSTGVPADLFASGEPRWLGVQFNRPGEAEQPRVQLVSVPYALKAADAETLGGKPASAYLLAPGGANTAAGTEAIPSGTSPAPAVKAAPTPKVTIGTSNCIGVFTNSTDLGCSVIWQNGINIGIDTMNPGAALDLGAGSIRVANYSAPSSGAGLEMAYIPVNNSGYLFAYDRGASVAKDLNIGGSGAAVTVKASGNIGVGVASPASKMDVAGDINFSGVLRWQSGLFVHNMGTDSTALGLGALGANTSSGNTAVGRLAMQATTTGNDNTAVGSGALYSNTTGMFNVAIGSQALNTSGAGSQNVAVGRRALLNSTGSQSTAIGDQAMLSNTTGIQNTAVGAEALLSNITSYSNTALGYQALYSTVARSNTAVGNQALTNNTLGVENTAVGDLALYSNTTGSENTAVGEMALSNSTGIQNIAVGDGAGSFVLNGSYNIEIGNPGLNGDNAVIRIGAPGLHTAFFAGGIRGVTTGTNNAIEVMIDSNGQLGTVSSSRRYKEDIHDMGDVSSGLMRLRPVTFRYKKPFEDGSKPVQYGLIAEEVEEVYPDLVARGADGQIETVKYQLIPTMLLNEVQRQELTIQEQQREIDALKAKLAEVSSLETRLAALESASTANRPNER